METFEARMQARTDWGEEAVALRFSRPTAYDFVPGQYAVVTVQTPDGPVGKPFTIASAPLDDYLEFTTRISDSAFKQALDALVPGDPIRVSKPSGRLLVPSGASRLVFLVGGVGITPARSILRHAVQTGLPLQAFVFFGNRDDECIPYRAEFEAMETSGVRIVHVLEHPSDGWQGERGFITAELVRRHGALSAPALWIVAGPPVMVGAMERVLDELAIPAEERMIERFAGYA